MSFTLKTYCRGLGIRLYSPIPLQKAWILGVSGFEVIGKKEIKSIELIKIQNRSNILDFLTRSTLRVSVKYFTMHIFSE